MALQDFIAGAANSAQLDAFCTLFLDEVGDVSADIQVKLLRVIQDGELERLGSNQVIKVDVRIIAATNQDLEKMVEEGAFLLDVRTQEEWDDFHAPQATLIPLDQLESRVNEVPNDQDVVVICRSGNRSQTGRDILISAGHPSVTSVDGGMNAWRSAGYPTE